MGQVRNIKRKKGKPGLYLEVMRERYPELVELGNSKEAQAKIYELFLERVATDQRLLLMTQACLNRLKEKRLRAK